MLAGIGFVVVGWRIAAARNYVLICLAIFVGIEALTFPYIYPRLDIMLGPDSASQPIDALRVAAEQFTKADRIRSALSLIADAFAIAPVFPFFPASVLG